MTRDASRSDEPTSDGAAAHGPNAAQSDPPTGDRSERGDRPKRDGGRGDKPGQDRHRGRGAELGPVGGPRRGRWWIYLLVGALLYVLLDPFGDRRPTVPYSVFEQQLRAGNVDEVTWQGQEIRGSFSESVTLSTQTGRPLSAAGDGGQDARSGRRSGRPSAGR
ncbi:MAG: ATP-dependent metallopeptidase FtsH/Yme1/Tma family protein [Trueperaceae bacterium]|nr:ATP-dependent metallopeptidase FtsH/Yme1/Tma family protein [Trueperaceae bacterium]